MKELMSGGELVTKPLIFEGRELLINLSASAAGSIRVRVATLVGEEMILATCPRCHYACGSYYKIPICIHSGFAISEPCYPIHKYAEL